MSTNAPRQLNVALHDRYAFGMDSAQVRVLKQMHKEGLSSLL